MIPTTSTTLLRALGAGCDATRWEEFVLRYEPMMRAYLKAHFVRLDADDLLQETLIALTRALPNYRYCPEEGKHFHNYLTGILRNRALQACRKQDRYTEVLEDYAAELPSNEAPSARNLQADIVEIALKQLLADTEISAQSKQIFVRVAVNGESPAAVAESLQVTRNNVDQIKSRLMKRLRELTQALEGIL